MAAGVFAGSYARKTDISTMLTREQLDYVEVFPGKGKTQLIVREALWKCIEEILRADARKRRAPKSVGRRKKGYGSGTLGDDPLGIIRQEYRKLLLAHARRDPKHAGHRREPTLLETCSSAGVSLSTLKRVCQGAWPPL